MAPLALALSLYAAEVARWGEAVDPVPPLDSIPELTNVVAVAAGGWYSLFLRADGSVWGVPYTEWYPSPAVLLASNSIAALEVGGTELAIQTDGRVVAVRGSPLVPPDLTNAVAVAKGLNHRVALRRDGTLLAWGNNDYGQTNIPPGLNNVVAIAAGSYHNLALRSDGTVAAWGDSRAGQASVPAGLNQVVAIAAGGQHSLALRADGTVVVWGTLPSQDLKMPESWSNVVAVAAWGRHNLMVQADGTLEVWGSQISAHLYPPPEARSNVLAVTTSASLSMALLDGPPDAGPPLFIGSPFLMGTAGHPFRQRLVARYRPRGFQAENLPAGLTLDAESGVLSGVPESAGEHRFTVLATNAAGVGRREFVLFVNPPTPHLRHLALVQVPLGGDFAARIELGTPAEWFDATGLPPGLELEPATGVIAGVAMLEGHYPVSLVASNRHGVSSGRVTLRVSPVIGWGSNDGGALDIPPDLGEVTAIAAGSTHSLALRADGTVRGWGSIWDNVRTQFVAFPPVPTHATQVVAIAAGDRHRLALRADGTAVSWGSGGTLPRGLSNVVALAAGTDTSYLLQADGSLGSGLPSPAPAGFSHLLAVAAHTWQALALRADGRVLNLSAGSPPAPENTNFVALAVGHLHALALRADGTVLAWGDNSRGQTNVPAGLSQVVAIAAGHYHSLALRADGTVVAWGDNSRGQTNVPAGLSQVVAIAAGGDFSLALVGYRRDFAPPRFTSPSRWVATLEHPFYLRLAARGGAGGWTAEGLPAGLTLDPVTGEVRGLPEAAGTYRVVLTATNASGVARQEVTLFVNRPVPAILNRGPAYAWLGQPFTYPVQALYQPAWFGAAGLPPGLHLDTTRGLIEGVPTVEGRYPVTLLVSNRHGMSAGTVPFRVGVLATWDWTDAQLRVAVPGMTNLVALAAGGHSMGLRADGRVVSWDNPLPWPQWSNIVALALGANHGLALQGDGQVQTWGYNPYGQIQYGQLRPPSGLSNIVAIATSSSQSLALQADGTVVAWGKWEQVPEGLSNVVAIAAAEANLPAAALQADGRVVLWNNTTRFSPPLSNLVAIAPGHALDADGRLFSLSWSDQVHLLQSNVVAMSGNYALLADGRVTDLSRTSRDRSWLNVLRPVMALAAGDDQHLFLVSECPTLLRDGEVAPGTRVRLVAPLMPGQMAFRQWYHNGRPLPGASGPVLELPAVRPEDLGTYTVHSHWPFATLTHARITLQFAPGLHLFAEPTELVRRLGQEATVRVRVIQAGPETPTAAELSGDWTPAFEVLEATASQGEVRWTAGQFTAALGELFAGTTAEVQIRLRAVAAAEGTSYLRLRSDAAPEQEWRGAFAVFKTTPALTWEQLESGPALSWPVVSGFVLEQTGSLTPPVHWERTPNPPTLAGDRLQYRLPFEGGPFFFRLARP